MSDRGRLERFLREEVDRYYEETRHEEHEDDALKSVCHVIHWACALDEHHENAIGTPYRQQRDCDPEGQYLAGVRYARNRATHQHPQLLMIAGGATFPWVFPAPLFEIAWKPVGELPPPHPKHPNKELKIFYETLLAGQPVRFSLDALTAFFGRVP